jgi:hypothetical protein
MNYLCVCLLLPSRIKSRNASNGMTRRLPRRIVASWPLLAWRRNVFGETLVRAAACLKETESGWFRIKTAPRGERAGVRDTSCT